MVDWSAIVWVGIVGAVAMSAVLAAARATGVADASMSRYHGCMLTGRTVGATTIAVGFAMHLVISVISAGVYALAFAQFWGASTWYLGLFGGLVHWSLGGIFLPAVDRLNRCVAQARLKPMGAFGGGRGTGMALGFLTMHMVFGLIVGWLYTVPAPAG